MKLLHATAVLEAVTQPDDVRECTHHVWLDIDTCRQGTLVATTGTVLAAVPVEIEADDSAGWIPKGVLAAVRRNGGAHIVLTDTQATRPATPATGRKRSRPATTQERPDAGRPVNWRSVMLARPDRDPDLRLDPYLLTRLAQALGAQWVDIWIQGGKLYVEPLQEAKGRRGVLMQVSPPQ